MRVTARQYLDKLPYNVWVELTDKMNVFNGNWCNFPELWKAIDMNNMINTEYRINDVFEYNECEGRYLTKFKKVSVKNIERLCYRGYKLSNKEIKEIKESGLVNKKLAENYNISTTMVSYIKNDKYHKHIE